MRESRSRSAGRNGNALSLDRRPAAQDPRAPAAARAGDLPGSVQLCVRGVRFAIKALFRLIDRGDGKPGGVGGGKAALRQGWRPLAAAEPKAYGATPAFLKRPLQSIALAPKSSRALISTPSTSKPMRVSM